MGEGFSGTSTSGWSFSFINVIEPLLMALEIWMRDDGEGHQSMSYPQLGASYTGKTFRSLWEGTYRK